MSTLVEPRPRSAQLPAAPRANWVDERTGIGPVWRAIFQRRVPAGLSWWYSLGAACLFVLVLQSVTGILLAMNYSPSPDTAYDSVSYLTNVVPFGFIVRGLHHWGASAMVVLVVVHLASAFVLGAHRYPREATWIVGVVLLLITMGFGFTGYLLPWDQKAYWATTVGTNMPGTAPFIGPWLVKLMRGGNELGAVALARFYSIHVLVLPAIIGLFAFVHLFLVIWHGVSVPPGRWHRGLFGRNGNGGATTVQPDLAAAADPLQDGKKLSAHEYHERYHAFKARGPHFWPEVIADDAKIAFGVFVILLGLTVVFGVPTEPRADASDTNYIPRPEWYFMFLFQMLKFFPGNLEWLGALVVPGIFVGLLFLAPALSGGAERRPLRRPLAIGSLAAFAVFAGVLTLQAYQATPSAEVEGGRVLTSAQLRGFQIVGQQGCASCHIIGGHGETKGPPLDGIGQRMTTADIHFFMERPKVFNPAATMAPLIPPLTHEDVENVTQYLLTLPATEAKKGGANVR